MSETGIQLGAAVVAAAATLWAGLFALAREAPSVPDKLGGEAELERRGVPLGRAMQQCHLALLVFAGAAAAQAVGWWHHAVLVASGRVLLSLALLFVVGSGIPRGIGALAPEKANGAAALARRCLGPFRPLLGLISAIEKRMQSLLPAPEWATDRYGPEHHDMLDGVFSLGDTTVEEAMTPRLDVEGLNADASWREVVEQLRRSDHARLPVFQEDLDNISGILYAKDVTPSIAGVALVPEDWREFVRPAPFVPESKALTAQLRDFQRGPSGLAVVVDEFGGTSGIITLEDVLEEVVGEIHGEYDDEVAPPIEREGDDRFWVDGSTPLDDLSDALGTCLEIEDVTTVGGLVYSELGQVPKPGEELHVAGFRVVVEQVEQRRIRRVYFERLSPRSESEELGEEDRW